MILELAAILLSFWSGVAVLPLLRHVEQRRQRQEGQKAEQDQAQLLTEWLYGQEQDAAAPAQR